MRLRDNKTKKECGILLPLSSLPSKHGIGTLGIEAYHFIDFLKQTNQNYWQILPLCPLGRGNSPYSTTSCFAGEILYIDIDNLINDGLIDKSAVSEELFPLKINYNHVRRFKLPILKLAAKNFDTKSPDYLNFCQNNAWWLEDYAIFSAIKDQENTPNFLKWQDGLKYRHNTDIEAFKEKNQENILFYKITQFLFWKQYEKLKQYANSNNIKIIGDIPFYVDMQSADIWANKEVFKLGNDLTPILSAGVPPDIFSSTGQLWDNPVYNWEHLKNTDYLWWRNRLIYNCEKYDVLRIDHFRAFADYYTVPYGAPDARFGSWKKGVGLHFWNSVKPYINNTEIIAEDLGGETSPIVQKLVKDTDFPNMKVLQFAFNSDNSNVFLPQNFGYNSICYTGTHDNDTSFGWYKNLSVKERVMFERIVPLNKFHSPVLSLIAFAMKSKAKTVIIPFWDYLELDSKSRINIPGSPDGNWEWRYNKNSIDENLIKTIIKLTKQRK